MDFKVTIILNHVEEQSVEDLVHNCVHYIKDDIHDETLIIESIEDITDRPKQITLDKKEYNKIIKSLQKAQNRVKETEAYIQQIRSHFLD
jgi:hypothetical protein